jgi:adenylylsulfate kinase
MKARQGEIKNFTGIDSGYETPESPEIVINTAERDVEACAMLVIDYLRTEGVILE